MLFEGRERKRCKTVLCNNINFLEIIENFRFESIIGEENIYLEQFSTVVYFAGALNC